MATSGTNSNKGGEYTTINIGEEMLASSTVSVTYVPVGAAATQTVVDVPAEVMRIQLRPGGSEPAVPGSVLFSWMGHDYVDSDGAIYRDRTPTDPGIQCGTMNYTTCTAVLDSWAIGPNPQTVTLKRLWTQKPRWSSGIIFGHTSTSPIRPGGMTLTATAMGGGDITAQVEADGDIVGDYAWGSMDFASGAYQIMFGRFELDSSLTAEQKAEWWYDASEVGQVQPGKIWVPRPVDPNSLRYNATAITYLPIDADLMGITPERLPPDGRMPMVRAGDFVVIGLTITGPAFAPMVGQVYNVGETLLSSIDVLDSNGGRIDTGYTHNLDAGTLTFTDLTGYPAHVIVRGRAEVYRRVRDVRIDGTVSLTMPVGRAFPVGAVLSSALRFGDKFAFVERVFDQQNWSDGVWVNAPVGPVAGASYSYDTVKPEVTNRGAITERWAMKFRNSTDFDLIGEHVGQIASGNINTDFSPPNPAAGGLPYFVLRSAGWGTGWAAGNVLFLHTVGAEMSLGVIRTTNPGSPSAPDYNALFEIRGTKDTPPASPFA